VNNPFQLTTEDELIHCYATRIQPYWLTNIQTGSFTGVGGITIHYAEMPQPDPAPALVISPGRVEAYIKYQELAFDLHRQGYHLYLIDHRGQGLSGRMLPDSHKGYVNSFEDYVTDLKSLYDKVIAPKQHPGHLLLSHSMGGTIAALYLQQHPLDFVGAAFSSPMFAINFGSMPTTVARLISASVRLGTDLLGLDPSYAPTQGVYVSKPFKNNRLTHSQVRYEIFRKLYEERPEIQIGGATHHWLHEGILAAKQAVEKAQRIQIPVLLLSAGNDRIVSSEGQMQFCARLHQAARGHADNGSPEVIAHACHELFFEADRYRLDSLNRILRFYTTVLDQATT
jgi:lysophospholipase